MCEAESAFPSTTEAGLAATVAVLNEIPGGSEVVEWFGGYPIFHDAEVLELRLVRKGPSSLRLAAITFPDGMSASTPPKHAVVTFNLSRHALIDIRLDEFSGQNVIYGLTLRRAVEARAAPPGSDLSDGSIDIELEPCFGAFGRLRATIENITITPVADYQTADELKSVDE